MGFHENACMGLLLLIVCLNIAQLVVSLKQDAAGLAYGTIPGSQPRPIPGSQGHHLRQKELLAVYGHPKRDPNASGMKDVSTILLDKLVGSKDKTMKIDNSSMRGDPSPGMPKVLRITVNGKRVRGTGDVREGSDLDLDMLRKEVAKHANVCVSTRALAPPPSGNNKKADDQAEDQVSPEEIKQSAANKLATCKRVLARHGFVTSAEWMKYGDGQSRGKFDRMYDPKGQIAQCAKVISEANAWEATNPDRRLLYSLKRGKCHAEDGDRVEFVEPHFDRYKDKIVEAGQVGVVTRMDDAPVTSGGGSNAIVLMVKVKTLEGRDAAYSVPCSILRKALPTTGGALPDVP